MSRKNAPNEATMPSALDAAYGAAMVELNRSRRALNDAMAALNRATDIAEAAYTAWAESA